MRRMIVAVELETTARGAADAITRYLLARGWRVWHWIDSLWLVADLPEDVTAEDLWAEVANQPGMGGALGLALDVGSPGGVSGSFDGRGADWFRRAWGLTDDTVDVLATATVAPA